MDMGALSLLRGPPPPLTPLPLPSPFLPLQPLSFLTWVGVMEGEMHAPPLPQPNEHSPCVGGWVGDRSV